MRISRETVDRIYQSIDIVDVVKDYVNLKKRGANWAGLSPFTTEKTPSFYVSPAKQIFKCFSTGKGGDAIKFLMEVDKLTYAEALKYLAGKYGIDIVYEGVQDDEADEQQSVRDSLYIVLNYAKNHYQDILIHDTEGQSIGLSYLKERGLSDKTIRDFELGYSKNQWDQLYKDALKNQYSEDMLEKAGLIKKKEDGKIFDFFRDRVIFPIHNASGKVIALAGRILGKEKSGPKYINSPETEVYHKSQVLYGLYQARNSIRVADVCYLVEGYMDVLSLYQAGIQNVVASSGTSLTDEQVRIISRYSSNIVVLYDGDKAGINAALRGTDKILESGLNLRIVLFPEGEDPDSYVQKVGKEAFAAYLKSAAKDFITFKTEILLKDAGDDPILKAKVIHEIVHSISLIQDGVMRALYFKKCSQLMDIDEEMLISEYRKTIHQKQNNKNNDRQEASSPVEPGAEESETKPSEEVYDLRKDPIYNQECEIIRLLLNYAEERSPDDVLLAAFLLSQIEEVAFKVPDFLTVIEHFRENMKEGKVIGLDYFMAHTSDDIQNILVDILADKHYVSPYWEERFGIVVPKKDGDVFKSARRGIIRLQWGRMELLVRENLLEMRKMEKDDPEKVDEKLQVHIMLKQIQKPLADEIGVVIFPFSTQIPATFAA